MNITIIELVITTIISIVTLFAGRYWGLHDRRIDHDKKVLNTMLEIIPSNGSILFIREFDFGGSFGIESIEDIYKIDAFSKRPEFRFLNKKIDDLRLSLVQNIQKFSSFIGFNTFPLPIKGRDINRIKQSHEFKDINEYKKIHKEINELADMVCNSYDSLITSAIKKGIYTE